MSPADAEPASSQKKGRLHRTLSAVYGQLNFYRLHILYFIFTPLIFSGIFYASNGATHISYIDALFNCVSAMVVCGLATVDLSSLTPWQQVILYIQMFIGNPIVVSWVVVYNRRRLFRERCENIVLNARTRTMNDDAEISRQPSRLQAGLASLFRRNRGLSAVEEEEEPETPARKSGYETPRKGRGVRTDMIRRMDDAPKLVNPSGNWIGETPMVQVFGEKGVSEESATERAPASSWEGNPSASPATTDDSSPEMINEKEPSPSPTTYLRERSQMEHRRARSRSTASGEGRMTRFESPEPFESGGERTAMPRTQTIEFAPDPRIRRASAAPNPRLNQYPTISAAGDRRGSLERVSSYAGGRTVSLRHTMTYQSALPPPSAKHTGFGGFPLPHQIVGGIVDKVFPKVKAQLARTMTMPRTTTISSRTGTHNGGPGVTVAPYISFDAIVGRNSVFHELTNDQLEELGGVEYRALNALLWLLPLYYFGIQLICFAIIAPYMTYTKKFQSTFLTPTQHRDIAPAWFSMFQILSAFTNTGTSLVDQSMIPFQTAYPMILALGYLILAGNTAFPVFLRFGIWLLYKAAPQQSALSETLHFLLDHPRRCFIYLFPSYQTWFLVLVLFTLNLTDWVFFLILDIGNAAVDAIPVGTRMIDGLLQAFAVRAAGFAIVTISALAPAVKVLYVIMMYISVYPIAMSVRSTNVYEEQSLGIYSEEDGGGEFAEPQFPAGAPEGQRMTIWSNYLAQHVRRQLSFDMWWLSVALFLVCIIEKRQLSDENAAWFDVFAIVFELVSAYGTVGLSLGLPSANYSLSGAFSVLSKLVVIAVMLRGRHRGLPVAIDRAVVLPFEFRKVADEREDGPGAEMSRSSTIGASASGTPGEVAAGSEFRRRGSVARSAARASQSPEAR